MASREPMSICLEFDALASGAGSSRRNQFLMDLLETPLPGLYFNVNVVDKESELYPATRSPQIILDAGSPRLSHSQCVEFLCTKGPGLLIESLKDKEEVCSLLLNMADIVEVLPPANEPFSTWDILDMTLWRATLWAVVLEMKTVEEIFPSLIGDSGAVYVLSASPYPAFLRALAAEITDRRKQLIN